MAEECEMHTNSVNCIYLYVNKGEIKDAIAYSIRSRPYQFNNCHKKAFVPKASIKGWDK